MQNFLILACLTVASFGTDTSIYDYRMTELIQSSSHQNCLVHTSTKLTLVQCPSSFEVYPTKSLVEYPHGLTNGGSNRTIKSPKQSRVPGLEDRLTFLEKGNKLYELALNEETNIIDERRLLVLPISSSTVITDVTVFQEYVACYVPSSNTFLFYEKPLVIGNYAKLLKSTQVTEFPDDLISFDYSFRKSSIEELPVNQLFIVTPTKFNRFDLEYDNSQHLISLVGATQPNNFNSTNIVLAASTNNIMVACRNCTEGSFFEVYDKDFSTLHTQNLTTEWPYELTFREQEKIRSLQVFISSKVQVDLIQIVEDWEGLPFYTYTPSIFSDYELIEVDNHFISASASPGYVLFKKASYAGIFFIPICTPYQSYVEDDAMCDACPLDQRTYGLQDDECVSCSKYFLSYDTEFQEALYEQVCSEGAIMSLSIAVALPIIVSLLALICCCVDYNRDRNVMEQKRNMVKNKEEEEIKKLNAELDEMDEQTNNLRGEIELLDTKQEKLDQHLRESSANNTDKETGSAQKIIINTEQHLQDNELRFSAQKQQQRSEYTHKEMSESDDSACIAEDSVRSDFEPKKNREAQQSVKQLN